MLLLPVLLTGICSLEAQEARMNRAAEYMSDNNFYEAIRTYERLYDKGYDDPELLRNTAFSHYQLNNMEEAALWYDRLQDTVSLEPQELHRFAHSLMGAGKEEEAVSIFKEYSTRSDLPSARLIREQPDWLDEIRERSDRYRVARLKMNTDKAYFAPALIPDTIVFTAASDTSGMGKLFDVWTRDGFYDLYALPVSATADPEAVTSFSPVLNSVFHEATASFTADGNTVYFTRNNAAGKQIRRNDAGGSTLQLFRARRLPGGNWSEPEPLPFNSDEYSVAHPAVSPDGSMLYFASDMTGGSGESDIYRVVVRADGSFGAPENLGEPVNTDEKETFPYISQSGDLYFASEGHPGFGGLDIFRVLYAADGSIYRLQNMGAPVNSNKDDFGIVLDATGQGGYFSSDRDGGPGGDDIFRFDKLLCSRTIAGSLTDARSGEPVGGAQITLFKVRDSSRVAREQSLGNGAYFFEDTDCYTDYSLRVEAPGYESLELRLQEGDQADYALSLKPLFEAPEADLAELLDLEAVYFDLNSSFLREEAYADLDKVVAFMKDHPEAELQVYAYTDTTGTAEYNQWLSERRARRTADYLVENGVAEDRLHVAGKGEWNPPADCEGADCEKPDSFYRRTEFKLVR